MPSTIMYQRLTGDAKIVSDRDVIVRDLTSHLHAWPSPLVRSSLCMFSLPRGDPEEMLVCEKPNCTTAAHVHCYFARGSTDSEAHDWSGDMGFWTCHLCSGKPIPAFGQASDQASSVHADHSDLVAASRSPA